MTDLVIPADTAPSRIDRGRNSTPVSSFDPDDVATVDDKVSAFWADYPEGAIDASDVEQIAQDAWRVTAYVWKNRDADGRPDSTGSATRTVDLDGHVSGAFALETAQSVAVGRALRFLGIHGSQVPDG